MTLNNFKRFLVLLGTALILSACGGSSETGSQATTVPLSDSATLAAAELAPTSAGAHNDSYSVKSGETLRVPAPGVLQNDSAGRGGGSLKVLRSTQAAHGTVSVNRNGSFTYRPAQGYAGTDRFTYTIRLNNGRQSTAIVTITVTAAPSTPPVASNDSYIVQSGQILSIPAPGVMENDSSGSGGTAVTIVRGTQASHGTVSVNADGSFTYQSAQNYVGADSFTYTISNTAGQESTATVALTVTSPPSDVKDISQYLGLTETQIAKYKDNKQGAASYTFDDGLESATTVASIFESFGLRASFYINANLVWDWPMWQRLAGKGHEIGNHSMTHRSLADWSGISDADLDYEINQAQQRIEDIIGIRPLVFVFPYTEYSDRSLSMVYQGHVATRVPGFSSDPTYRGIDIESDTSMDEINGKLNETVNMGGWFYVAGHGVDGNGWEPITSQFLRNHLTYATSLSSRLWIDTFVNVARYRLCREKMALDVTVINPATAAIRIGGNYSASLCTAPMTVAVPVIEMPQGGIVARTANGTDVPSSQSEGMLLLNINPGEEVYLQTVQAIN